MSIFYQKIRSVSGRTSESRVNLQCFGLYDIFALTETNLNDTIKTEELGFVSHNVIRCDRSVATSKKKSGGGVLLALQKNIKYSIIPMITNRFEYICVKLHLNGYDIIIVLVYVPPFSPEITATYHSELIDFLTDSLDNYVNTYGFDNIIILGDFNVPGYDWIKTSKYSLPTGFHSNPEIRTSSIYYSNFCKIYGLFQYNFIKNISGNILDLVFSNFIDITVSTSVDALFDCDSHHKPLDICLPVSRPKNLNLSEFIFDYKNADFDLINQVIQEY